MLECAYEHRASSSDEGGAGVSAQCVDEIGSEAIGYRGQDGIEGYSGEKEEIVFIMKAFVIQRWFELQDIDTGEKRVKVRFFKGIGSQK